MIWENIKLALSGLMTNKMRALLTMLGIIIGIGSVIAIVTVGNSLTSSVSDSLVSLGGNNLQVGVNQRPDENGNYSNSVSYYEEDLLSDEMLDSLRQRFSQQIKALIIANYGGSGKAQDGRLYANLQTVGVNPDFFVADKVDMVAGRALRESDMEGARKVAVVSDLVVDNMFGGDANAALGKTISLASGNEVKEYAIVGVYHYQMQGIFLGGAGPTTSKDTTTEMYVPNATMKDEWGDRYFSVELVPQPGVDGNDLAARIEAFFDETYYKNNENFMVRAYNLQNEMASITSVLDTISIAIGIIAGISLLVGGIGVMNIMLVSITERTREIAQGPGRQEQRHPHPVHCGVHHHLRHRRRAGYSGGHGAWQRGRKLFGRARKGELWHNFGRGGLFHGDRRVLWVLPGEQGRQAGPH